VANSQKCQKLHYLKAEVFLSGSLLVFSYAEQGRVNMVSSLLDRFSI